jgi:small subunit ribosomal protein S20
LESTSQRVDGAELPNIKSAKKRVRLSRNANARNRAVRSKLRTAVKRVENAENAKTAEVEYRKVQVLLDRAATGRLLHPNTVARMKSNLARRVGAMS